jgi:hypothetical protein
VQLVDLSGQFSDTKLLSVELIDELVINSLIFGFVRAGSRRGGGDRGGERRRREGTRKIWRDRLDVRVTIVPLQESEEDEERRGSNHRG